MPISTTYVPETFQGDGISTAFAITFPYQLSTDIVVQKTVVATGVVTTLVLGTDYSVTPASNSPANTGTVTMLTGAIPVGSDITISRAVPLTQLTTWVPNDPNPSTAIMNAVDKLTMEVQDFNYLYGGRSWYLRPTDVDGSGAFDARNNRGTNLGTPITGTDAVNVDYLQSYINAIVLTGSTTVSPVFTFTGDGSTTSFQLAGVTISFASGFQVSIDGLIQTPTSDYTIALSSPPTINFTSAPPDGTKIVVVVRGFSAPSPGGVATAASFLRGDGVYANALIGAGGPASIPTDGTQLFDAQQIGSDSAIRVTTDSTHTGYLRFGVSGSGNLFNSAIGYNAANAATGFYSRTNPFGALSSFYDSGNVYLANSLFVGFGGNVGIGTQTPAYTLDVVGNVNITGNYTGNASGSLITSGQVLPQFLASNVPAASLFLRGDGVWALPAGGGGGGSGFNTTTTATFTIAAIASSQTVSVTDATGVNVGNYIYVSDGTHTIVGQVTGISGLDLTVDTTSIIAGTAGDTMGSGSAASLSGVPGQDTILVSDFVVSSTQVSALHFTGNKTIVGSLGFDSYIDSISGGIATIKGQLQPTTSGSFDALLIANHLPMTSAWLEASTAGCLLSSPLGYVSFGNLNAQYIEANSGTASSTTYLRGDNSWSGITPASLVYTGSAPVAGQVPSYNSSGQFQWVNAGSGGLPSGGTTAQFLRGDQTWSNALDGQLNLSNSSLIPTPAQNYYGQLFYTASTTFGSGSANAIYVARGVTASNTNESRAIDYFSGAIYSGSAMPVYIDNYPASHLSNLTETGLFTNIVRAGGVRTTHGPWQFAYTITTTSGAITVDLANGAYQRITPTGAVTFTINDTTPVPTLAGWQFASELTLEINGAVTVTWPVDVTWANGASAPTLSSGVNLVRLVKRQGVSGWLAYTENLAAGGYTDAQARTAVLQSTYLIGTSTVAVNVTGGTSATFSIPSGGIGTTQLANAAVTVGKISATGTPSSTTYLRGDGAWTTPSAATGQAAIQFQAGGASFGAPGAITTLNLTGAVGVPTSTSSTSWSVPIGMEIGTSAFLPASYTGISRLDFGSGFTLSNTGSEVTVTATGGGGGGSTLPAVSGGVQNYLLSNDGTNAAWRGGTSTPIPGNFLFTGSTLSTFPAVGTADIGVRFSPSIFSSAYGSGSFCDMSFGYASQFTSGQPGFNGININMQNNFGQLAIPVQVTHTCNPASAFSGNFNAQYMVQTVLQKQTGGFSICLVADQLHYNLGGPATSDSIFFTSIGPNAYYSSSAGHGKDPYTGVYHAFTSGYTRIGEVDYGNAWSDFGLQESRGLGNVCSGIEFFPQYQGGRVYPTGAFSEYPAQWAIAIGNSGQVDSRLIGAKQGTNYIGILIDKNALAPLGYGIRLRGASGTYNGASATSNAPGALVKMSDTAVTGIDFAGSTNENTPLTATSTGAAVIQMTDSQSIRIGTSFWIRGQGTHLQYSTNGSSWTNIV